MIKFKNISKYYPGDCAALKDVTFDIKLKEFVSVVGRSGAGKTTLLKLLLREEQPSEGEVIVVGKNIKDLKSPPNNHLESLKGKLKGYYSIRIK